MNRESSIKKTYSILNREIVAAKVKLLNSCSVLIKADRVFVSPYCCFIFKCYILVQCISTCEKLPMNRESSIKKTYSIKQRDSCS